MQLVIFTQPYGQDACLVTLVNILSVKFSVRKLLIIFSSKAHLLIVSQGLRKRTFRVFCPSIFRLGVQKRFLKSFFNFFFMYLSNVFLLCTEVYFNSFSFFLSIARDNLNMSLNEMRRRAYTLKIAS